MVENTTSLKNYKYGCHRCEFCQSQDLKRFDQSLAKLTVWTCNKCSSIHYWKWDLSIDMFQ